MKLRFLSTLFCTALTISNAASAQSPTERLKAHSAEFRQAVIEVIDGVHVAVGYGLANSILIEGDDGVIIVDSMESPATARLVKAEFDKITDRPVQAIIYTHFHADHIGGGKVFAGDTEPEVFSHEYTEALVQRSYGQLRPIIAARSIRQFGLGLPPEQHINCGIGPRLVPTINMQDAFLPPTTTVGAEGGSFEVAGIRFELVYAPGETDDQLYVWLPEQKVLLPGDNFYKAFPNLYAVRGTAYRDVRKWADSLDSMIAKDAEYLVPSHTRPISGKDRIRETLSNYRDAIRFVHQATVNAINAGLTPDELVAQVQLPEELARLPYLQEFYGTVEWSVRNIFNGYLGWFDGNATNLSPLSPKEHAARMAQLAGGPGKVLEKARSALDAKGHQWAAELADVLIMLEWELNEALVIKADALTALADEQISANGRNYYLVSARELRQRID